MSESEEIAFDGHLVGVKKPPEHLQWTFNQGTAPHLCVYQVHLVLYSTVKSDTGVYQVRLVLECLTLMFIKHVESASPWGF
jgi:hypothetical protein